MDHCKTGCCHSHNARSLQSADTVMGNHWASLLRQIWFWCAPLGLLVAGYLIDIIPLWVPKLEHATRYWSAVGALTAAMMYQHRRMLVMHRTLLILLVLGTFLATGVGVVPILQFPLSMRLPWVSFGVSCASGWLLLGYLDWRWAPRLSLVMPVIRFLLICAVVPCAASFFSTQVKPLHFVVSLTSVIAGCIAGWKFACDASQSSRPVLIDSALSDVVSTAVWTSFLYSSLQLLLASRGVVSLACFFFCDCWKTLGMVRISRTMGGVLRSATHKQGVELGGYALQDTSLWWARIPLIVQLVSIGAVGYWSMTLGLGSITQIVQMFATINIAACPCVAVLAIPLAHWRVSRYVRSNGNIDLNAAFRRSIVENKLVVATYYLVSLFLSAGGHYAFTGRWLRPWQAGAGMALGQCALFTNSLRSVEYLRTDSSAHDKGRYSFYSNHKGIPEHKGSSSTFSSDPVS